MALDTNYPCTTSKCLGIQQQLALLAFLMADLLGNGDTPETLEDATKDLRNLSETQLLQQQIGAFGADAIARATPEAMKCWECYSIQKLSEIIAYLSAALTRGQVR